MLSQEAYLEAVTKLSPLEQDCVVIIRHSQAVMDLNLLRGRRPTRATEFAYNFASSIYGQLIRGKTLSEKQIAKLQEIKAKFPK